jgi:NtrC-family two-component system sensor histidine kinase KinB
MSRSNRHRLVLGVSVIALGLLVWLTVRTPLPPVHGLLWFLFTLLIVFTTTFGVPLGGGEVSLLPMTVAAAYLVMGPVHTAWAAFVGTVVHGVVRYRWATSLEMRREPDVLSLAAVSAANATMHSLSILVGSQAYTWAGGVTPPTLARAQPWPVVVLCAVYLGANFVLAGLYISGLRRASAQVYLRSLPNVLAYEATPLIFAPLMALTYTYLGPGQFLLLSLALVVVSLIARDLALARRRLERRVRELDSLQVVGRALSATLDLDAILVAVHDQVAQLMPARSFYIALYDPDTDEVSFPLAIENGERVHWPSRRLGNGLTEYILRARSPVLVERDVDERVAQLGLEHIGAPASSWLGVPIMAGAEPLGVIAVQSGETPGVYDAHHEQVLVTIAAQASTAVRNARLYARTDQALARRVQEMDSILRTTREGVLLLDLQCRVVTANRELARFVGLAQLELVGQALCASQGEEGAALAGRLGYEVAELESECDRLAREGGQRKQKLALAGPPKRFVERTLAPVRDGAGTITGWLLVFRDVTEEEELNQFRDDMTHMLVHDLRSPLAVLRGSLDMIENDVTEGEEDRVYRWIDAARSSSDRILHLIDQLLDISKLESGQLPIHPDVVNVNTLFEETAQRLATLAREARIKLQIVTEPGLSPLYVDPGLIGRALTNLVDNAIKFTPDGGMVRLWARRDLESDPPALLIGVSDTGHGIVAESQRLVFLKFQQVVSTTGRRQGTGLGLSFCKLAVEAHGGRIWIESPSSVIETTAPGEGTTLVMRLPGGGPVARGPAQEKGSGN